MADGYNVSLGLGEPSGVGVAGEDRGPMGGWGVEMINKGGKRKTDRVGAWCNFAGQGLLIYSAPIGTRRGGWNGDETRNVHGQQSVATDRQTARTTDVQRQAGRQARSCLLLLPAPTDEEDKDERKAEAGISGRCTTRPSREFKSNNAAVARGWGKAPL